MKLNEAEICIDKSLQIIKQKYGENHKEYAKCLRIKGLILTRLN